MKILICGMGNVGKSTQELLKECGHIANVTGYDPNIDQYKNDNEKNLYDFAFICVNARNNNDGKQDLSDIEMCVDKFRNRVSVFFLRTTVLPGTTKRISLKYNTIIHHMPEYLRERSGYNSVKNIPIITSCENRKIIETLFKGKRCYSYNLSVCEMTKYFQNSFFAMKVCFANAFFDLCKRNNIDYTEMIDAVMQTARPAGTISKECLMVPGPDGEYGFGGMCLPKDSEAIMNHDKNYGLGYLLEGVLTLNKIYRNKK